MGVKGYNSTPPTTKMDRISSAATRPTTMEVGQYKLVDRGKESWRTDGYEYI